MAFAPGPKKGPEDGVARARISAWLHRALRLPLRPGLFANFERSRLLRHQIPVERLRASPMHVVFCVTELHSGTARFLCDRRVEELAVGEGAHLHGITQEVEVAEDSILATFFRFAHCV